MGEKVQGISSINGRCTIDRGRLRIVREMEKPKDSCTTHGHELRWGNDDGGNIGWRGIKG